MVNRFSANCVLSLGNISLRNTCLVSGLDNSAALPLSGLLELFFSCSTDSILYQAILARLYPLIRLSLNADSGNKEVTPAGPFLPCGTDASAQLINGKRRSIPALVPSKSSM